MRYDDWNSRNRLSLSRYLIENKDDIFIRGDMAMSWKDDIDFFRTACFEHWIDLTTCR